jgi:hypothetical protein
MLRDPERRARSQHAHRVAEGAESRSFIEAVMDELERGPTLGKPRWDDYLGFSMYGAQLDRWATFHPPESIGVFDSELMYTDTDRCLASIAEFVGISPDGFVGTDRNYSSKTGGGTKPGDLPAAARSALEVDREQLVKVLAGLPVLSPRPDWAR